MSTCRLKFIQPIEGELFRFYVPSVSQPEFPHTVDLEFYKFNGGCDCPRFHFNCEPLLSRGADKAEHLRCGHIKDARSFFLDEILPKIADKIRHLAKPLPLVIQAQGIVTQIQQADPCQYPDHEKIADLLELKDHILATVDQIRDEIESARDPEKHEDAPSMAGSPEDMRYE